MARRNAGFTLIEVLVAMTIMAVIGAALVATVTAISRSWQSAETRGDRLGQLQEAFLISWYDFSQAAPFQAATASFPSPVVLKGETQDAYLGRHGFSNPFGQPRSNLEAVHYAYAARRLVRYAAPAAALAGITDSAAADDILKTHSRLIARDVDVTAAVIDQKGDAYTDWGTGSQASPPPPQFLSLQFDMTPFGEVEEDVPIFFWQPGGQNAPSP